MTSLLTPLTINISKKKNFFYTLTIISTQIRIHKSIFSILIY